MFIHHRTSGFILKKVDRREADQLLTIYTKDFGKLEILARAVRKISSKLSMGAGIFYLSEIEFIQGKTNKTLTDAILIEKFENLRKDLEKLKISYQIAEVFDELVRGQEKDEALWQLLLETFGKLNTKYPEGEQAPYGAGKIQDTRYKIYYYFFWNLFSILGYQPELYNCAVCQKHLKPDKLFFSPEEGGIICNDCQKNIKLIKEVSPGIVKILRILIQKHWQTLLKLKVEKPLLQSLNIITEEYYSYIHKVVNS